MRRSFCDQFGVLLYKNARIFQRSAGTVVVQLLIGAGFLGLLAAIQLGLDANTSAQTLYSDQRSMPETKVAPIPLCHAAEGQSCAAFAFAPSTTRTRAVVEHMRAAQTTPALPAIGAAGGPHSFGTASAMLSALFDNQNYTQVAVEFVNPNNWNANGKVQYVLHYNATPTCVDFGLKCADPVRDWAVPVQVSLDAALVSIFSDTGVDAVGLGVSMKPFPHPDLPFRQDALKSYGVLFLFAAFSFNFIVQLSRVVHEKEARLREAMHQVGLMDSAYWLSWFVADQIVSAATVLVLCAAGAAFQLDLFLKNDPLTYIAHFALGALSLSCLGYTLAAVLRTANAARNFGFLFYVLCVIAGSGLVQAYFKDDDHVAVRSALSLLAPLPFIKGLDDLITQSSGSDNPGIRWAQRAANTPAYPLADSYHWMLVDTLLYILLAWYLDNVIPAAYGTSRPFYFFLTPSYWASVFGCSRRRAADEAPRARGPAAPLPDFYASVDPDVRAEAEAVSAGEYGSRSVAVEVVGLRKEFGSTMDRFLGRQRNVAVDHLSFAIDHNSMTAICGHNGAGKTTAISMMIGSLSPTAGDVRVCGHSVTDNPDAARSLLGVCPQHDVLWPSMSSADHVYLFARLRGLTRAAARQEVERRLKQVELWDVRDIPAGAYSGGMQRRLSLAIALVGDPRFVVLDEPTTGLDIISRRKVWDMIEDAKHGRAMLLITHHMNTADVLGDRVAVMSHGRMQALGTSLRLKNKFGAGYRFTLFAPAEKRDEVVEFVTSSLPGTTLELAVERSLVFRVPPGSSTALAPFFHDLKRQSDNLGISDVSIRMTTLEEVFVQLSREEEAEAARLDQSLQRATQFAVGAADGSDVNDGPESLQAPPPLNRDMEDELRNRSSFWAQFRALTSKSVAFQRRQYCQMACLVLFPCVAVGLLVFVQHLISGLQSSTYDMDCVADLTRSAFVNGTAPDLSFTVGLPLLPFEKPPIIPVEAATFDVPIARPPTLSTQVGSLRTSQHGTLPAWVANLQHGVKTLFKCDETFQKNLNKDLLLKNAYQARQAQEGAATGINALGKCATSGSGSGSSSSGYKPSAATTQKLDELIATKENCTASSFTSLRTTLTAFPGDQTVKNATGLAGYMTTGAVEDPILAPLYAAALSILRRVSAAFNGLKMADVCASSTLRPLAAAVFPVDGLCWTVQHRDAYRALTVRPVPDVADVDATLYEAWGGSPLNGFSSTRVAAYAVSYFSPSRVEYTALYNETGSKTENWPTLVAVMHDAILARATGGVMRLDARVSKYPPILTAKELSPLAGFSVIDAVGGIIFPFVLHAILPVAVSMVMYEKEFRLRESMLSMGLEPVVYNCVNYGILVLEYTVLTGALWLAGRAIHINLFTIHSPVVLGLFLFIWGQVIVSLGLFLTSLFSRARSATASAFILIFAFVIGGYQVMGQLESDPETSTGTFLAFEWMPPMAFMRAMLFLVQASALGEPVTLANWHSTPLPHVITVLGIQWPLLILLFLYCDAVLAVGWGVGKHPLFFLPASMQCSRRRDDETDPWPTASSHGQIELPHREPLLAEEEEPTDVAAERNRVLATVEASATADPEHGHSTTPFLRVLNLHKRFPAAGGAPPKVAVHNLTLGVDATESLGLLGGNGAGKTTSISCLTNLISPTSGTAIVGQTLDLQRDSHAIHLMMGVCPQHDTLWGDLTATEHLRFYARLKGFAGPSLSRVVERMLHRVQLSFAAHRPVKNFSGGMKRRLSVAIAMVGNPRLCYLDEPSTGLDPASRRMLWHVIRAAKRSTAQIITSHSLVEADALCDRLAIMTKGKLRTIGTSQDLKRRFGSGFTLFVTVSGGGESEERLFTFVRGLMPSARRVGQPIGGLQEFEVLRGDVDLATVFSSIEDARAAYSIVDWGITETTLDQVFFKITEMADEWDREKAAGDADAPIAPLSSLLRSASRSSAHSYQPVDHA